MLCPVSRAETSVRGSPCFPSIRSRWLSRLTSVGNANATLGTRNSATHLQVMSSAPCCPPHYYILIPREPLSAGPQSAAGVHTQPTLPHIQICIRGFPSVKTHRSLLRGRVWLTPHTFLRTHFCVHQRSASHICIGASPQLGRAPPPVEGVRC